MFFLMRTAFWLTLVLVLIPLGSNSDTVSKEKIDPIAAFFAAQETVSDLGGFCNRNPGACETGGNALAAIGAQARDGARIVYEFLDTQVAKNDGTDLPLLEKSAALISGTASEDTLTTGTVVSGTLTDEDKTVPWQGTETATKFVPNFQIGPIPRPNPRAS
ncbi:DUF5330 domain-containing protein [Roseibium algae]|uniref:DUF5330 domain-containing protein n=1 Tax=Roseibium algae TaxID=3123038 RepID=A0ABU8TIG3_9HYPH